MPSHFRHILFVAFLLSFMFTYILLLRLAG